MKRLLRKTRHFYWRHIRHYRYEICGSCSGGPGQTTIHHYGCGRPIGPLWRVPTPLWNFVVAGIDHTVLSMRPGAATSDMAPRAEGVAGILCLKCFDRAAENVGMTYLMWHPEGSGDYSA